MTTDEALEVLRTIDEMYPRFNLTKRKAAILIPILKEMDYTGVMKNLAEHVMHHLYPPMLSEIAAYEETPAEPLAEVEVWQEEADGITEELKQQLLKEVQGLLQEKGRRE